MFKISYFYNVSIYDDAFKLVRTTSGVMTLSRNPVKAFTALTDVLTARNGTSNMTVNQFHRM